MTIIYRPKQGLEYNPLIKGNLRNKACACGSGIKTKKCCGTSRLLESEMADEARSLMKTHEELRRLDEAAEV